MRKLLLFFGFLLLVSLFLSPKKTSSALYSCTSVLDCPCDYACNESTAHCYKPCTGSDPCHICPTNTPTPTPRGPGQDTPIPDTPIPGATDTPPPCPFDTCGCNIVPSTDESNNPVMGCWCQRGCWQWTCSGYDSCTQEDYDICSSWAPGCPFDACITCGGTPSNPTDVPTAPHAPSLSCDTAYGATCSCTSDTTPRWYWTLTPSDAVNFMLYPAVGFDGLPGNQLCSVTAGCSSNASSGQFIPTALAAEDYELQVAAQNLSVEGPKSNPVDAVIDTGVPGVVGNFIANPTCTNGSPNINFSWTPQAEGAGDCLATVYQLQISKNSDYSSPIVNEEGLILTVYNFSNPENGTTYYARVRAVEKEGTSIVHDVVLNWVALSASGVNANCPWYKLKTASFYKSLSLTLAIPATVTSYDSDDVDPINGIRFFSIGEAGVVQSGSTLSINPLSANNWKSINYTKNSLLNPAYFLEYVKSRKEYNKIDSLDNPGELSNKIYYLDPASADLIITNANLAVGGPLVLIVDSNVVFNQNITPSYSVAIVVNGEIKINQAVTNIEAILIGNNIDFVADAATTTNALKIKGNVVSVNSGQTELKRSRADTSRPSIFIVLDPQKYFDLLPYLSTANYEWKQLQ